MSARISRPMALGRTRLANLDDVPVIMKLVTTPMALNFNIDSTKAIEYLIEHSILSICQLDANGKIVGFLATKDYPPVPAVRPACWEDFVWSKYKAVDLNARNTLFLHLLCFEPVYGRDVVDRMLKSLYMYDPYLMYVAMMKPFPDHQVLYAGQARCEASFKKTLSLERGVSCDRLPTLWIADRKDVCPRLKIRRAVEEDNDDIIPIIERHSAALRELYGDFYVSEIISRHPESRRLMLVCEDKELAVGVLCLNTQINYESLEENYELSPYNGLRKSDTCNVFYSKREEPDFSFEGKVKYKRRNRTMKKRISKVDLKEELKVPEYTASFLDDDDTIEYDIVNIDSALLSAAFSDENNLIQNEQWTPLDNESQTLPRVRKSASGKTQKEKSSHPIYPDPRLQYPEPKRYVGEPNAFLLELFAMHPDYDERHGFALLEVAFEMFPDRDYCVVAVPSSHPILPILEHFTLVAPLKFRKQFVKDSLFVAHVNSVKGDLRVRRAESFDVDNVDRILHQLGNKSNAMSLFHRSITSSLLSPLLLLSQNQPVGLVIVGPLQDSSIRITYDLETELRRQGTDGMILVGVMSPVLEAHTRWYLREIFRHSQYKTLFWTCSPSQKQDSGLQGNLISLASHMIPVRPRRYTPNMIDPENKLDEKIKPTAPFALWYVERPMTSLPKITVNTSIVVVGASGAGLSFLETLLLGPKASYLLFTNITLVSEYALPAVAEVDRAAKTCVPRRSGYPDSYVKKLPLLYYIDVIAESMVKIDRKNKCIYLNDGGVKYYDDLVLTCGKKFQQPNYSDKPEVKDYVNPKLCNRISMGDPRYKPDDVIPPSVLYENVMIINSRYEAHVCLNRLLQMIDDDKDSTFALSPDNPVVVYGDCLDVYSCLAALIEIGVSPSNIVFVEPFPAEDNSSMRINCFNNEKVDGRVQEMIVQLGIKVHRKCYLYNWTPNESRVDVLWLRTFMHVKKLPCFALFYYGFRAMDLRAFKAINECGLVYNDGIVVGTEFDTNDPNIFAAGSCTKYSQRLLTTLHQRDYSSKDVGEALGYFYLKRLDPFITDCNQNIDKNSNPKTSFAWEPVMTFRSPIVQSATLPGPLYYMTVQKPGRKIPNAIKALLPNQGPALETNKNGNYFQIQLNALYCIESLCCLSKEPFPKDAFCQLYGHHEARFKRLMYRYRAKEIDDFYEYFTQPWTTALYQEPIQQVFDYLDDKVGDEVREYIEKEFGDLFIEGMPDSAVDNVTRLDDYERQEELRKEAYNVWIATSGDNFVWKILSRYFHENTLSHPYYAKPDPSLL
ncbi:cilia- and flagella-associated protein 61-like [Aricia agestis]|uniref:cilia- and flagella-associated protein 61-like n=1 Tax=Aricia agestis TaxID=91739 RepID=UPI001C2048AA|nr:cilia- and flagella-associated protein 61-like [Aricia agestis]